MSTDTTSSTTNLALSAHPCDILVGGVLGSKTQLVLKDNKYTFLPRKPILDVRTLSNDKLEELNSKIYADSYSGNNLRLKYRKTTNI